MVASNIDGLSVSLYSYIPDIVNTVIGYSCSAWILNIYGHSKINKIPYLIAINFKKTIDAILNIDSLATMGCRRPFKQIVFYENTV